MLSKAKTKYIQTLGQKKHRDEEGLFIAEGTKVVSELLQSLPTLVQEVFAVKEWIEENKALLTKTRVVEVDTASLEKISQLSTPNKVVAIAKKLPVSVITAKNTVILALDSIQDPGNFGTIIRIADWFGIGGIVCSPECADIYNPKTVQSTMGSIARVKVMYTDLASWLVSQKEVRIYAAALEGQDIGTINKIKEGIIVIGNESKGIHPDVLKLASVRLTIPGKGGAESLNAGVATGIILSHLI